MLRFGHEQLRAANSELAADWIVIYVITRGEMAAQENISLDDEDWCFFMNKKPQKIACFLRSFLRCLAIARRISPAAAFSESLSPTICKAMIVQKRVLDTWSAVAHIKTRI